MKHSLQTLRYNHGVVESRYVQIQGNCLYVYKEWTDADEEVWWGFDKIYDLFDAHTRTYKNNGEYVTLIG
jgi:hypothetical protein